MSVDAVLGSGLIGNWAASFLFGTTFFLTTQYFNTFPNDDWTRKALVSSSLLFSLAALAGECADVWIPLVTNWGSSVVPVTNIRIISIAEKKLISSTWSAPVYTIFNQLVGTIVNSYLISRFYSSSNNILVTAILSVLVLATTVTALLSVVLFTHVQNSREMLALVWSISNAVCDVSIAVSLLSTLRGMKTAFNKNKDSLFRRIMVTSMQNGIVTSLAAIAGMIATISRFNSNIPTSFYFLLGPLYVLTLLSNFNSREAPPRSGSRNRPMSLNNINNNMHTTSIGIHVHRTAMVTVDPRPATASETEMERGADKWHREADDLDPQASSPDKDRESAWI
ncbi:hypothetical protein B0H19DRAFT_1158986 [Mycena capillaripes]|nr:hypothetical protein B0H19DRAFT_1158986 [Mycena capillaripes]